MSAKPKRTGEFDSFESNVSNQQQDIYAGQDIFVDDDPAVQPGKRLPQNRSSESPDFSHSTNNNLKIEKLTYVHQMLGELRKLSVTLEEPMVAYLIEMALLEADTALNVGHFKMDLGKRDKGMPDH